MSCDQPSSSGHNIMRSCALKRSTGHLQDRPMVSSRIVLAGATGLGGPKDLPSPGLWCRPVTRWPTTWRTATADVVTPSTDPTNGLGIGGRSAHARVR
jgi:hypothetical protein